ncbi:hypothetical protein PGB90_007414 [Kerria lacca]
MDIAHIESDNVDEEIYKNNASKFTEIQIRHAFMRKVLFIVGAQLIITCLIIVPLLLHEPTRKTIQTDRGIFWASFIIFFAVYLIIVCCTGISRKWPQNYIILLLLTVATAIWVGCICAAFNFQLIFLALSICILLVFVLTIFSLQTSIDFTGFLGVLFVVVIAMFALAILYIFIPSDGLTWIILIGMTILLCVYFIIDIQLMMGEHLENEYGKKKEIPTFRSNSDKSENELNTVDKVFKPFINQQKKIHIIGSEKLSSEHKTHSCYVCGKTLSSTSSYYVHMKQHSGHKPYHCPMCDVSFCRKPYLEVHLRTHTGERPFQCNICSKRFTQKSSLNIHKRAHTGERPYSCDICDKKFAVKSYVDAHRWTHIFEKPLSCEKCQIPFNSKSQYVLHMRSHSSSLTYECPCGRTFTKDSYLIRHQIKVHHPHMSQNVNIENGSANNLPYQHIFTSNESLNKKSFDLNKSLINNLTENLKKNEKHSSESFDQTKAENGLASSIPVVTCVLRNSIQSYVQDTSSQLAKL